MEKNPLFNGRPTQAMINLAALNHNLKRVKHYAPNSKIFAIIKANAYGHGALSIAKALADQVEGFGVACLAEALELRQAGIGQRILILEGFFNSRELPVMAEQELDIVVHSFEQIKALSTIALAKPLNVWLKVNTGMNRLGFTPEQIEDAIRALNAHPNLHKPLNWLSHFSDADDIHSPQTLFQLARFKQFFPYAGLKSLANSAAVLAWPDAHADYVRPGLMLYGVSPILNQAASEFDLRPVMTLSSALIAIKEVRAGEPIGYNGTWKAPENMRIGIAAIGYGDGYPLQARTGTPILLNGRLTQLIGRVAMDMLTVDLRSQPHAKVGDSLVLWGEGLPIETVARWANTIPYELFCRIGRRVDFKIVPPS